MITKKKSYFESKIIPALKKYFSAPTGKITKGKGKEAFEKAPLFETNELILKYVELEVDSKKVSVIVCMFPKKGINKVNIPHNLNNEEAIYFFDLFEFAYENWRDIYYSYAHDYHGFSLYIPSIVVLNSKCDVDSFNRAYFIEETNYKISKERGSISKVYIPEKTVIEYDFLLLDNKNGHGVEYYVGNPLNYRELLIGIPKIENGTLIDFSPCSKAIVPKNVKAISTNALKDKQIKNIVLNEGIEILNDYSFGMNYYYSTFNNKEIDNIPSSIKYLGKRTLPVMKISYYCSITDIQNGIFKDYFKDDLYIILPYDLEYIDSEAIKLDEDIKIKDIRFGLEGKTFESFMASENDHIDISKMTSNKGRNYKLIKTNTNDYFLLSNDSKKLVYYFETNYTKNKKTLIIPEPCEIIERGVFSGVETIDIITMPSTIKTIKHGNFYHCVRKILYNKNVPVFLDRNDRPYSSKWVIRDDGTKEYNPVNNEMIKTFAEEIIK